MSTVLPGKRSKELAAIADANRLTFSLDDPGTSTELPFTLFVQGTGRPAQHVMRGRLHGMTVRGFDFLYQRNDRAINQAARGTPGEPPVVPYEEGKNYGCALVALTFDLPFLHIAPRSRKRQLANELEITPQRKELGRLYQCWAVDRPGVAALVDHPIVTDFLVGTRGQFEFELCGPGVLAMVNSIKAVDFPAFMAMTVRFAEALQQALAAPPAAAPPVAAPPAAPVPAPPSAAPPVREPEPVPAATVTTLVLPRAPERADSYPLPPPPPDAAAAPLPPPPPDAGAPQG